MINNGQFPDNYNKTITVTYRSQVTAEIELFFCQKIKYVEYG